MSFLFGNKYQTLRYSINTLHERVKRLNKPPTFTFDEFLALMAPPDHWPILKQAAEVSTVSAGGGYHSVDFRSPKLAPASGVNIYFHLKPDDNPPLIPRGTSVLPSAPSEITDRLVEWANKEIEVARVFKKATQLLEWLNSNMETKNQVRFVWPVILTICSVSESTADLADRIREFKPQRSLPFMPTEVRKACAETSGMLTSASMLEDKTLPPNKANVTVEYNAAVFAEPLIEGALGDVTP